MKGRLSGSITEPVLVALRAMAPLGANLMVMHTRHYR